MNPGREESVKSIRIMKRNLFIRIPIACVLGIITTLAVAWGCAMWVDVSDNLKWAEIQTEKPNSNQLQKIIVTHASFGSVREVYKELHAVESTIAVLKTRTNTPDSEVAPNYISWANALKKNEGVASIIDARGWPFFVMYGGFDIDSPDGRGSIDKTYNAIILDFRPQLPGNDKTMTPMIPLAPIWRGFIYNSLIYAALWFFLLLLPQFIKTRIRNARNQCRICGYDLRGTSHTICPECGEEVNTKKKRDQ